MPAAGLRHVLAAAPILVIAGAILTGGTNGADAAALLATALLIILALAIAAAPAKTLTAALSRYAVPLAAAGAFALWALATTLPHLTPLTHPLWAQFGVAPGAISLSPYRTLEGLAAMLGPLAAAALGAVTSHDLAARNRISALLVALSLAAAAFALFIYGRDPAHGRLMLLFGSANAAATLFGALLLFCLAAMRQASKSLLQRPFALAAAALCALCLALTQSRAGIAASALAIAVFSAMSFAGSRRAAFPLAACALLLAIAAVTAIERLPAFSDDAQSRALIVQTHWVAFLERPLIGHGLNTFHELNTLAMTPQNWSALRTIGAAHNIYVQTLEETGIVGAILFALMLGPLLWRAWRAALIRQPGRAPAAAAFCAMLLALVHGAVDFGLQVPAIACLLCFALTAFAEPIDAP